MPEPSPTLEMAGVTYTYPGSRSGVRDVSLAIASGTIYGLLGINGAGKTTLMRLMTGLIDPVSGTVRCFGGALWEDRGGKLALIGSLIESPSLYAHLTAREHLRVFACYTGAPAAAVDRALAVTGIAEVADRRVRHLSLGMKQRLGLATALLHDPPMLILDEPTNGLDPEGIAAMRDLLRRLASEEGKTIVVSSHLLAEVEKTATRIGILHEGALRFEGTAEELSARLGPRSGLVLRVGSPAAASAVLAASGIDSTPRGDALFVEAAGDPAAAAVISSLAASGVEIYEAKREAGSLETDFLRLIGAENDAR